MSLEYKNKDKIKSDVNVEIEVVDGKIQVPDTPDKVEANYEFSKSYYYVGTVISIALPLLFKIYGGIEVVKKRNYKHRWTEGIVLVLMFLIFSWITTFPKTFRACNMSNCSPQRVLHFIPLHHIHLRPSRCWNHRCESAS